MRSRPTSPSSPHRPPPRTPRGSAAPLSRRDTPEVIQGLRAGLAVFTTRREDIVSVTFARAVRAELSELCRWAAGRRVPCVEMPEDELERWAGSSHCEGLCVEARPRPWLPTSGLVDVLARGRGVAIALDRVRNPYNVGAILRSAAFFGLDAALIGAPAPQPDLPVTAVRVAEGGVEHVRLSRTTDLADTLSRLRARGVRVYGAEGDAPESALGFPFARPAMLVMGNEREGLGARVRAECDGVVAIRGCGAVESLNVAVAAGVLFAEVLRAG